MAAPARPPVVPELFTGEKSWDEWVDHFMSVAEVCGWDDANKLKWLRVRLSGRASTVFRRLPEDAKADYGRAKAPPCSYMVQHEYSLNFLLTSSGWR